jgi:transposase InsO family protein
MLCENIQNKHQELSLDTACSLLNVSRHCHTNQLKPREPQADPLLEPINAIKRDPDCRRYGYRRVTAELHRQGIKANHKRVLETMRKHGLTCKKRVFRIRTTDSNHGLKAYPNLIKDLEVTRLNQVWVSDVSYIRLANGETVYLAVIMDRFSRRFLGWQLSYNIDAQLCLDALGRAFKERQGTDLTGLIHHSDQGVQYASNEYVSKLEGKGIKISMSRKANPYDNAHIESAIKTIKYEEVYMDEYESFSDAYKNIKKFIEVVYDKKRLHSSIGYKTPAEFEKQYELKEVTTF